MKARLAVASGLVAALSLTATPAHAIDRTPSWKLQNSSGSYTGAIFHRAANDRIYGNAVVVEPGGAQKKISMTVDTNQDWPYGIKVWHPSGSCLKVYERILFVWVRAEKYKGSARDVWVTKSIGSAGEKFRVKILRSC